MYYTLTTSHGSILVDGQPVSHLTYGDIKTVPGCRVFNFEYAAPNAPDDRTHLVVVDVPGREGELRLGDERIFSAAVFRVRDGQVDFLGVMIPGEGFAGLRSINWRSELESNLGHGLRIVGSFGDDTFPLPFVLCATPKFVCAPVDLQVWSARQSAFVPFHELQGEELIAGAAT